MLNIVTKYHRVFFNYLEKDSNIVIPEMYT